MMVSPGVTRIDFAILRLVICWLSLSWFCNVVGFYKCAADKIKVHIFGRLGVSTKGLY